VYVAADQKLARGAAAARLSCSRPQMPPVTAQLPPPTAQLPPSYRPAAAQSPPRRRPATAQLPPRYRTAAAASCPPVASNCAAAARQPHPGYRSPRPPPVSSPGCPGQPGAPRKRENLQVWVYVCERSRTLAAAKLGSCCPQLSLATAQIPHSSCPASFLAACHVATHCCQLDSSGPQAHRAANCYRPAAAKMRPQLASDILLPQPREARAVHVRPRPPPTRAAAQRLL